MTFPDPDWFREIDHTGDIGIQVTAPTLPRLFERAALGTFHVSRTRITTSPIGGTGRDRSGSSGQNHMSKITCTAQPSSVLCTSRP